MIYWPTNKKKRKKRGDNKNTYRVCNKSSTDKTVVNKSTKPTKIRNWKYCHPKPTPINLLHILIYYTYTKWLHRLNLNN